MSQSMEDMILFVNKITEIKSAGFKILLTGYMNVTYYICVSID